MFNPFAETSLLRPVLAVLFWALIGCALTIGTTLLLTVLMAAFFLLLPCVFYAVLALVVCVAVVL